MKGPLFMPEGDAGGGGAAAGGGQGGGSDGRSLVAGAAGGGGQQGQGGNANGGGAGGQGGGAVAETWWKGYIREDGTLDKTRLDKLPDTRKDDKAILERYGNIDDISKALAHHARLAREKGLTPPREGATEAERAEFMAKLARATGAPAKPEEYGLKAENDPELQLEYDEFAKVFHKHAISPAAVKELFALNEARTKLAVEKAEAARAEADAKRWEAEEKKLRDAFGPLKAQKIQEAIAGARWLGLDTNSPLFTQNADVIIAAAKVASKIEEARYIEGGGGREGAPGKSAQAELSAMANDPQHRFYAALRNPGQNPALHQEALAYRRKLSERAALERANPRP